jgi:hypothetical protein
MWLLIVGGVISFFALVIEEATAAYAFTILLGVPAAILSNLVFCWILHAFGSIAEKHEDGCLLQEREVPSVVTPNAVQPIAAPAAPSVPKAKTTSAPAVDREEVAVKNGLCPDCNQELVDSTIVGIKECPECGRMFG